MFLNRNGSHCLEAHFDVEHDSFHVSTHLACDESGYDGWDSGSDTTPADLSHSL